MPESVVVGTVRQAIEIAIMVSLPMLVAGLVAGVAVSIFIEPLNAAPGHVAGTLRQGALNVHSLKLDDRLITVLGEVPMITVRQIAQSVARR